MLSILLNGSLGITEKLYLIAFQLIAVVLAITVHEWAHAFAAYKMGDPTARNLGRMTLNPFAHLDWMGFLMLMLVGFGWARPVPVNERNFRNPHRGGLVVASAGIIANLIMASVGILVMLTLKWTNNVYFLADSGNIFTQMDISYFISSSVSIDWLMLFLWIFVSINCSLFVFNLLPIAPLDGSHILELLLIKKTGPAPWLWLRQKGSMVLVAFMFVCIFLERSFSFSPIGFLSDSLMNGIYTVFNAIGDLGAMIGG